MLTALIGHGPFRRAISVPRRRGRLHVMPTSTGFEQATGPAYSFDGRRRGSLPFAVLQHSVAGAGRLRYERQVSRIKSGQTMLVAIPHAHRYWLESGEDWRFFWIGVTGQEALRLVYTIQAAVGPVLTLRPETIDRLAGFCLDLGQAAEDEAGVGRLSAIAYAALMAVFDDIQGHHPLIASEAASPGIARACQHARAHLDQPLAVEDLAAIAGYSRSHFTRLFAAEVGIAPAEFVGRERMHRASRLLPNAALSIKQIATSCGFADPNYFAKVFRRHFDASPSEYRSGKL